MTSALKKGKKNEKHWNLILNILRSAGITCGNPANEAFCSSLEYKEKPKDQKYPNLKNEMTGMRYHMILGHPV